MRCFLAALALASVPSVVKSDERQTVVLPASQLASDGLVSHTPKDGKWWLTSLKGVPGEGLLQTGKPLAEPLAFENKLTQAGNAVSRMDVFTVPSRVPALELKPNLTGWYRIRIGMPARVIKGGTLRNAARLLARLSDEPYPIYLEPPQSAAADTIALVEWKCADLTGKTLHLEQPPAPSFLASRGWYGAFTHLVFEPLTEKEVAAAKSELQLPSIDKRLFGIFDLTTEANNYGQARSPSDIRAMIYRHAQAGFGRVYFRAWGSALDTSFGLAEAAPRWTDEDEKKFITDTKFEAGWKNYVDLIRKHDLMREAVDEGNKHGIEVHAWLRLTNLNRPPYCEFWHANPHLRAQWPALDKNGKVIKLKPNSSVLSFAYPEVRSFYVRVCKHLVASGSKGLLIDLLRHPPLCNFEPPVQEIFRKRHGVDILAEIKTKADIRRLLNKDPRGLAIQKEFLELFLQELRKEVGPDIEIAVRSRGPDGFGLAGDKFVKAGLVDTLIDGHWYSGNGPRPTALDTIKAAGTRGRAFVCNETVENIDPVTWKEKPGTLEADSLRALARHYRDLGVQRFGVYETAAVLFDPELQRAVRQASKEFAAK